MEFFIYGHKNVLSLHKTTLEFTKDKELTLRGDCIVGVNADFSLEEIKSFINRKAGKKVILEFHDDKNILDTVEMELNPGFKDNEEMVIRKTGFLSDRTFGINANKSSRELNREMIDMLKDAKKKIKIVIK